MQQPDLGQDFSALLLTGARWVMLVAVVWAAAITLALLVEVLTGGRLRSTWVCPPPVRRAALAALGLALTGGVLAPSAGATSPRPVPVRDVTGAAVLPVPARPADTGVVPQGGARTVLVRPGDSLWALARERIGPHARDPDVARLVDRVHARNRHVIGPDPDHLEPGMRLRVPAPDLETRR